METTQHSSGQVSLPKQEKPRRKVWWPAVAHEVAEYFGYEPRVPGMNNEGGSRTPAFGRHLQFDRGASYYFMETVYDRLREADRIMPYICDGKTEQPSASMTLRAAYGATATKYDDSAPRGARFLKMAQDAYAEAAGRIGRRTKPSTMAQVMRRFDMVFSGAMTGFPTDEDD